MPTDAPPGESSDPHWSGLPCWGRRVLWSAMQAWTLSPWAVLAYAGVAVAVHRWPGLPGQASAGLCIAAAWVGWRLLWRAAVREVDVDVAALLRTAVPASEPWAPFTQTEERVMAAHIHACLRRWGVSLRSSGWERLEARTRAGRREATVAALLCLPLTVHPWWLTL